MKHALGAALLLLGVAYPFAVYFSLDRLRPGWLAAAIAALWLARALHAPGGTQPGGRWLPGLAVAGCVTLALADSQTALRWYPVMINALLLAAFAHSLSGDRQSLIERLARLRHADLSEAGVRYTRRVTQVWCVFFIANGGIAAALALWGSWNAWTWYNGAASYALMGLLLGGERLLRPAAARA